MGLGLPRAPDLVKAPEKRAEQDVWGPRESISWFQYQSRMKWEKLDSEMALDMVIDPFPVLTM